MAKLKIKNIFTKLFKGAFYSFCIFFFLFVSLLIVLNLPPVKEQIAQKAISILNEQFKTDISVKRIEVDYFGNLILHEATIKDNHKNEFIKIKELKAFVNTFSIIKNIVVKRVNDFQIDQLRLEEPVVRVITYKGEKTDNFSNFIAKFKSDNPSNKDFKLKVRVDIIDGELSIVNQNLPQEDQFWLDASQLNLKAPSISVFNSDVHITIDQFSFKGKKHKEDYEVNQIAGKVHYSDTKLAFEDLVLQTDTSLLLGKLIFSYTKENGMANFSDKVNWDLDLKQGSKISGKDIRYFVKTWNTSSAMIASSKATGTLNNLKLTNPIISVEKTTYSAPFLLIKDMASSDKTKSISLITEKAHLQTSYTSLKTWLPKFISSKVPELLSGFGTANYTGDFSLDKQKIVVKGNMISSVGKILADVKLTDYSENLPKYEGTIHTTYLNLAPFTKSTTIGPITSRIFFDGKGFNLDHMDTKFDAYFSSLQVNDKMVQGISIVGNLYNKAFRGKIDSKDEHAAFNFKGDVDFSQKIIKTNFEAAIQKLDISYFTKIVDKHTLFQGDINANVEFSTIDDLLGKIDITSIILTKEDNIPSPYNDIQIQTSIDKGLRNLDIFSPNMITANIYGNYKLNEVPAMLEEGVGSLLVNYKPKKIFKGKEFSFILDVQKDLFDLLMLNVNISPGTTLTGRYIGDSNQLQMQMISEYIYYNNIKLKNPNIFINTADTVRQFMGNLSSLSVGNNVINNLDFSGFKKNDSLFASTKFDYGKLKDNKTTFDLNLYQTRKGNDVIFGFKPSDINLPQTTWTLNPEFKANEAIAVYNVITEKLTLQKISLKSEDSEIMLSGDYVSKDNFNLDLDLTDVLLQKIIPANLLKDMVFEGVANGTVEILKNSREFKPLVDFNIKGLKFNKEDLGDLNVEAVYNANDNRYTIDAKLEDSGQESFLAKGYIENKSGATAQVDINLTADKMNISPIGTFLQSIFSRFRGTATGDVHITGDINNPKYEGILSMSKVGFKLNYTGVDYELTKDQDLQISNGVFLLDNIELKDTKDGTVGTVFGPLMTKNFSEWGMDLEFTTNRLLVLNTTIQDNDLFFGKVYASGNFSLTGSTVSGIELSAKATALNGSNLTINSSSTTNATDISYIKFLPEQKDEDEVQKTKPPTGFSINAEVTAHSNSVVKIIISEETGDNIEVRGNTEKLKFNMNQSGVITMDGTYTIAENSKYYYKMFLNKDFTITPGSTIRWDNASPTNATMNINATYSRLVSNIGTYLGIGILPASNVTVTALLTGNLSKPEISFDIKADVSSSIEEQLKTKLNNNEGEKFNQVAGIVLFGNFISSSMGTSSYASSAYDIVLKQLTSVINNINNAFSLNATYNAGSTIDNTSDRISLDPTLQLNERLSIIGSVNMPLEQKSAADVWTYGAKINYDVSTDADGSLIISGFSKPSTFGLESSLLSNSGADNQAYGGSIVYKRSFNKFKELFEKKDKEKKKNKKDSILQKKDTLGFLKFR